METVAGIALGIAIFALVEASVASYKAGRAETKAIELYQTSCDSIQQRTLNLEYESNKMCTEHVLRSLDERIKALEFIYDNKDKK